MEFPARITAELNDRSEYQHVAHPDKLHVVHRLDQFQRLMVLGTYHNTDARQPYYDWAFSCFDLWENRTLHDNRIIIAEGEQDVWGRASTIEASIEQHYSEVGWQCFLADTYDIPIISGEPANCGELAELVRDGSYSPDELLLYYGIREIPVWHRMAGDKESFDSYMEKVFDIYKRKLGRLAIIHSLDGINFSYPNFLETYKKHFNDAPDPISSEMNDLYLKYTSAARVAKRVMKLRDTHLGATYERYWQKGYNIFSWYGIYHTLALSKFLSDFGTPQALPNELITGPSFQGSEIVEGSRVSLAGPRKIQASIQKIFAERSAEDIVWPKWLRPIKSSEDAAYVKQHFMDRAALPLSDTSYINYLVQPTKLWNPDFFMLSNYLEKTVEQEIDPLIQQSSLDPTWVHGEMFRGIFSQLDDPATSPDTRLYHITSRRLTWAFEVPLQEYDEFADRIEELRQLIHTAALHEGHGAHHAALGFDVVSKHLLVIRRDLKNVFAAHLTAAEHLQYALELLDHLLHNKELDSIIDQLTT